MLLFTDSGYANWALKYSLIPGSHSYYRLIFHATKFQLQVRSSVCRLVLGLQKEEIFVELFLNRTSWRIQPWKHISASISVIIILISSTSTIQFRKIELNLSNGATKQIDLPIHLKILRNELKSPSHIIILSESQGAGNTPVCFDYF